MNDIQKLKEVVDANKLSLSLIKFLLMVVLLSSLFAGSEIKDRLKAQNRKIDRLEDALNEQTRTLDNIYRQCRQSSP